MMEADELDKWVTPPETPFESTSLGLAGTNKTVLLFQIVLGFVICVSHPLSAG